MRASIIVALLVAAVFFVLMEPLAHAPLRNYLACSVADKRLRNRFVSEDELIPIINALMPDGCCLKPTVFERAFANGDGVTSKKYRYFLTPDGDFNVVNVGEKVLFTVKKYREDNVRKCAVGCFANEKRIPTDDGGDVSASSDEDNASSNEEDETRRTSYRQNEFKIPQVVKDKFAKYALKKHKDNSLKNPEQQMSKSKRAKPNNET
jgi:hypothetical protein